MEESVIIIFRLCYHAHQSYQLSIENLFHVMKIITIKVNIHLGKRLVFITCYNIIIEKREQVKEKEKNSYIS